jgi:2-polyprenyl-6-methoxyphenol hydroxylase-like FAD-dependent oxidoreductase
VVVSGTVLICGAGIGGSTLAYWLGRRGFEVTVVERVTRPRSSGNPVDVKGPAVEVVERMGIMPQLRAAASVVDRLTVVDAAGRRVTGVRTKAFQGSAGDREVEVPRADLATILLTAAAEHAEIRWGDTITGLEQTGAGVEATFDQSGSGRFDLVVGADGLHSTVRGQVFGAESHFMRHMGIYARHCRCPVLSATTGKWSSTTLPVGR